MHRCAASSFRNSDSQPFPTNTMSGTFANTYSLSSGSGYVGKPVFHSIVKRNSIYSNSAAAHQREEDIRRASVVTDATGADNRRQSVAADRGSVAAATEGRRGSVLVGSVATRRESVFGMESSVGVVTDPNRRLSTSLASDLIHKMRGDRKPSN